MSKIKLTGSNSGYVEISSAADAGNLTLSLPTAGTALLSNAGNVFTGITTFTGVNITDDITFNGASYNAVWDKSDNQLEFGDDAKLSFGGGLDMQLHSDGTNGVLRQNNNSGGLYIQADNFVQIGKVNAASPIYGKFIKDGAVELYFNGNKKLETTNTGAVVTGICTATSFSGSGENLTRTTQYSHRNMIINGDMRVSQRGNGTNIGNAGNFRYACDRFQIGVNGATLNITQDTSNPGYNTHPNGFRHSLKVQTHTPVGSISAGNIIQIQYKFEGYQVARLGYGSGALYNNPKSATLSFWAKSSLTGTFCVNFQRDGRVINRQFTLSSTDWTYFTATIPADTSIVGQHENAQAMSMVFVISAGSNYTGGAALTDWINSHVAHTGYGVNMNHLTTANASFQITGVQLEEGTVATPFEFREHADQLRMCQRYYAIFHPSTQEQIYIESGTTSTHSFWNAPVPAGMRTEPTVNLLGTWTGGSMVGGRTITNAAVQGIDNGGSSGTVHHGSLGRVSLRITRTGGNYGDGEIRHTDVWGNGNAWIGYDAEL